MTNKEKPIDVKCSVCSKDMQMPESFLKAGKKRGIDAMHMPHICSNCTDKIGDSLGDEKMGAFMKDVNKQMDKMGENNAIAEELEKLGKMPSDQIRQMREERFLQIGAS